ncbi:MAG: hypothetical protein IPN34_07255 [Planctomycetes bacterium]|nr:hypothetical protein [Planctomycetota bacterium]
MSASDHESARKRVLDRTRGEGILLFLCIPLVLVLLTRPPDPLGPGGSLVLALAIIAGHRRIARPWALRRAGARSLWSGRSLLGAAAIPIDIASGAEVLSFAARDEHEERRARAFLAFASRHRAALRLGVFVPLLALVVSIAIESASGSELFPHQRTATLILFQGVIAITVLVAALGHPRDQGVRIASPYPFPFPIHNLALLGIRNTLAVFVAVGAYWLALSLYRVALWPGP